VGDYAPRGGGLTNNHGPAEETTELIPCPESFVVECRVEEKHELSSTVTSKHSPAWWKRQAQFNGHDGDDGLSTHIKRNTCHVCCQNLPGVKEESLASRMGMGALNQVPVQVVRQEQKQQNSLWSYFQPINRQMQQLQLQHLHRQKDSCLLTQASSVGTDTNTQLGITSSSGCATFSTVQNSIPCCAYCDRPACHSCMRVCEGGCSGYYCTFCSMIDYQGVQERVICFSCRENHGCNDVDGTRCDDCEQKCGMDIS
jgi:hypothetical protein